MEISYQEKTSVFSNSKKYREQLLSGLPVEEKTHEIAGILTTFLEGGDGPPVILLHGPGESSFWWMRVIPGLVKTHRVIVPDMPGHGASETGEIQLSEDLVHKWLDTLIEQSCKISPVIAGHALGGAIAARFAINHRNRLNRLVLVDSLGLERFRPAPGFALKLLLYIIRPNEKTYQRFLPECIYDVESLRIQMGEYWEPFLAYNLDRTRAPGAKAALKKLMSQVGVPKIPENDLASITVPTSLIWGRHDRANRLGIAEKASKRFGWPLQVIEKCGDDPKMEQPEAFLRALYISLDTYTKGEINYRADLVRLKAIFEHETQNDVN